MNKEMARLKEIKHLSTFYLASDCFKVLLLLGLFCLFIPMANAQISGEYRTKNSGSFVDLSIWESFNGTSWVNATVLPPSGVDKKIGISSGDSVVLFDTNTFELGDTLIVSGIFKVLGKLDCNENKLIGSGAFILEGNKAFLEIGDSLGISSSGSIGNIQSNSRKFDTASNYIFTRTDLQFTGNGLPDTIRSLWVNNGQAFSDSSGLRLSRHTRIIDSLYFLNGKIVTDSQTAILTFSPMAAASGFGATKFINGPVRFSWTFNSLTHKWIPIGKDTIFRPISVKYNHNNTNLNVYQYELINHGPHYTTIANSANYNVISDKRYWRCGRIVGSSTINNSELGFTWGPSDGVVNYQDLVIGKGDDNRTEWRRIIGTPMINGNNTSGIIFVADNNPSTALDYILASTAINFLPVTLIDIGFNCIGDNLIDFYWVTADEFDILKYELSIQKDNAVINKFLIEPVSVGFSTQLYKIENIDISHGESIILDEITYDGTRFNLFESYIKNACNKSKVDFIYWVNSENTHNFLFKASSLETFGQMEIEVRDYLGKLILTKTQYLKGEEFITISKQELSPSNFYFFTFKFKNKVHLVKVAA